MTCIVDNQYRITIPRRIRKRLGLKTGDKVEAQLVSGRLTISKPQLSRNEGLVDLLLSCPVKDFILERSASP